MNLSRRSFLKFSGSAVGVSVLGIGITPVQAYAQPLAIQYAKETTTICPYCAVGCGLIIHTRAGDVINTEGDRITRSTTEPSAAKGQQFTSCVTTKARDRADVPGQRIE